MSQRCWEWQGSRSSGRYGSFGMTVDGEFVSYKAHRAAYELARGPIPDGLHVLHKCDNPACCNPDHLFLGTHQDNMMDMKEKGRAKGHQGEANFKAKLTEDQVRDIKFGPDQGYGSNRRLAKKHGISATMVSYIKHGKFWKHVSR